VERQMSARLTLHEHKTDPELLRRLEEARKLPPMTAEQREAQRRSWVVGEMMLEHEDMTAEEAHRLYDEVVGK
jgi:hypothetical protein